MNISTRIAPQLLCCGLILTSLTSLSACGQGTLTSEPEHDSESQSERLRSSDPLFVDVSSSRIPSGALMGNSMDAEAMDLDGDGDLDIVIATEYGLNKVLMNNGSDVFSDESSARIPQKNFDSEDIALADFSCDGHPDVIFVSEDNQTNEYYLNDKTGNFLEAGDRMIVTGTSNAVLAFDIDGDRDPDLLIGNSGQNVLLINDGEGNFTDETASYLPLRADITQDLELGDIDGDRDLDLLIGNEDANRVLINRGDGTFQEESNRIPLRNGREETREVDLGDVDNDGDLDIFYANVDFQSGTALANRLLLNDGTGHFADASDQLPTNAFHTVDADFADIDRDNDLDLLIGNGFGGGVQVWLNDGTGNFTDATSEYIPEDLAVNVIDLELLELSTGRYLYVCGFRGPDYLLMER